MYLILFQAHLSWNSHQGSKDRQFWVQQHQRLVRDDKRQSNKTTRLHSTHVMWLTPVPACKTTWQHDIRTTSNPARAKRWTPDACALWPVWEMSAVQMAGTFFIYLFFLILLGWWLWPVLAVHRTGDISSINMAGGPGDVVAGSRRDAEATAFWLLVAGTSFVFEWCRS